MEEITGVIKYQACVGVGNGSGKLFAYGTFEAIKRVQRMILENEKLRAENENLRNHVQKMAVQRVLEALASNPVGESDDI